MSKQSVTYNGVKVTADWPAQVESAQALTHYTIGGKKFGRIPFGEENPIWGERPCHDCAVIKGQFHVPQCEYEKCPACGETRAGGCFCDTEELREPDEDPNSLVGQGPSTRARVAEFVFLFICISIVTLWAYLSITRQ
jgi:hypothetical protein